MPLVGIPLAQHDRRSGGSLGEHAPVVQESQAPHLADAWAGEQGANPMETVLLTMACLHLLAGLVMLVLGHCPWLLRKVCHTAGAMQVSERLAGIVGAVRRNTR